MSNIFSEYYSQVYSLWYTKTWRRKNINLTIYVTLQIAQGSISFCNSLKDGKSKVIERNYWKKVIDHSNEGHEYLILIPINFALQLGPWLYFWEQWSRQHGGPGNVKYHQYAKSQRINETRDIFGCDNTFSLAQGSLSDFTS